MDPGAARFALARGYLLVAPSALRTQSHTKSEAHEVRLIRTQKFHVSATPYWRAARLYSGMIVGHFDLRTESSEVNELR